MDWTFIYLMFVLKLPIAACAWIVWWAIRAEPDPDADDAEPTDGGGGSKRPREPVDPRPRSRGPHGDPGLPSPPRSRPVVAQGRRAAARPRAPQR